MKRKTHKKYDMVSVAWLIMNAVGVILLAWVVLSFINVIMHNTTDYEYWRFNIFTMLFN